MAPASNEEQFKFLISCIRYSNNGKVFPLFPPLHFAVYLLLNHHLTVLSKKNTKIAQVDFGRVAKECNIVTKGAAAKRYERMMRSHGIAPNAASIKPAPSSSSSSSAPTSASRNKASSSKKRKFSAEEENIDDEEETSNRVVSKSRLKREVKNEMGTHVNANHAIVKEEGYREDSPSAQLQEGLQMGLGAGLCDVNRELVGYYSGGSSAGGSVNGDVGGGEFGDVEGYAGAMSTGGMNARGMKTYRQPENGFGFNVGGYGGILGGQGMMGNGNRMGGHGGQNMMTPRSHAAGSGGTGIGSQQYQSMGQGYDSQGGSDSPLLVE
ncbi:hypothetical protein OCU04_001830 [Sclerotinia nivalis]|uniref:Myb-like DNA-binding domain-containing protein n=1 Tax=Sclerotinia nivalis TaxID=352851 RepID=A0A9X0AYX7_9HELO|nr:hypothetical protein OCU04_001830 [Sclerotinia nivalis]